MLNQAPIRLLLAEKNRLVRKGLESSLNESSRQKVIASLGSGQEVLDFLKSDQPDVLLIDEHLTDPKAWETLKRIMKRYPHSRCIVTSDHYSLQGLRRALIMGAKAYMGKQEDIKMFELAILTVHCGEVFLRQNEILHIVSQIEQRVVREKNTPLSLRESQVLTGLGSGMREKEIAEEMNISRNTVHFHRMNLYKKTGSHNISDLLQYFTSMGEGPEES